MFFCVWVFFFLVLGGKLLASLLDECNKITKEEPHSPIVSQVKKIKYLTLNYLGGFNYFQNQLSFT